MTAQEPFYNFARGTSRFALRPIVPVAFLHDVDLVARRLRIVAVVDGAGRDLRGLAHGLILRRWMLAGNRVDDAPHQVGTSCGPFVAHRSVVSNLSVERSRSNLGATTPKHHGKPDIIKDQKTKPGTTKGNPVRSAKPPSPVQIRAAPLIFPVRARGEGYRTSTRPDTAGMIRSAPRGCSGLRPRACMPQSPDDADHRALQVSSSKK
jgi:hypothetical protein